MKNWKFCALIGMVAIFGCFSFVGCDNGNNDPTYDSITISPDMDYIAQGESQAFIATVNGSNNPNQGVTWTVTGGITGTTINNGSLIVANDETDNTILTINATSTEVASLSGTINITIHKGYDFFGSWTHNYGTEEDPDRDTYVITADNIRVITEKGTVASVVGSCIWTSEINNYASTKDNYPNGYKISGIVTDNTISSYVGSAVYVTSFLHNDKQSIWLVGEEIFYKQ
jgi:hypothetical protein